MEGTLNSYVSIEASSLHAGIKVKILAKHKASQSKSGTLYICEINGHDGVIFAFDSSIINITADIPEV